MARCTFREILTSYTNQRMAQLAGSAGFLPECAHPQSLCCPLWDQIKQVPAASVKQSRLTLGLRSVSATLPPIHSVSLLLGRLVLLQFRKL